MNEARWSGTIAGIILAFVAGVLFQVWHARESMKAHACTVTYWNPTAEAFLYIPLDDRACLKLGPTREYSGIWSDDIDGSFVPNDPKGLPQDLALSLRLPERLQVYHLAGTTSAPERPSGKKFRVTVRGRFGTRDDHWADMPRNKLVVDDIISARLEA
jgi:hypothetical protein